MTELEKLKQYLDANGYVAEWHKIYNENDQIIVYKELGFHQDTEDHRPWFFINQNGKSYMRDWDVVCTEGSYGGKDGLLEIYGLLTDDVIGWLTAETIIKHLKEKK